MKKNLKEAWIRTKHGKKCPFGLSIIKGCKCAGSTTSFMCPLEDVEEDRQDKIKKMNQRVLIYYSENKKCLYNNGVDEGLNSVNCSYGDNAQGMNVPSFEGSSLYVNSFTGLGLDGLNAYPLGFYADNAVSRNLFQGLFSLVGEMKNKIIKKAIMVLTKNIDLSFLK